MSADKIDYKNLISERAKKGRAVSVRNVHAQFLYQSRREESAEAEKENSGASKS